MTSDTSSPPDPTPVPRGSHTQKDALTKIYEGVPGEYRFYYHGNSVAQINVINRRSFLEVELTRFMSGSPKYSEQFKKNPDWAFIPHAYLIYPELIDGEADAAVSSEQKKAWKGALSALRKVALEHFSPNKFRTPSF